MKKSVLKISGMPEDNELLLFAISSGESEIHICLLLNKILNINLSLTPMPEIIRKGELIKFPRYTCHNEEEIEKYNLFVNRVGMQYLVPGIKKIDYLFLIQSQGNMVLTEKKLYELRSVPGISAMQKLDPDHARALIKYTE